MTKQAGPLYKRRIAHLAPLGDAFGLAEPPRHPMSGRVNILLLLSALLSALTGISGSARAQDQARAVAEGAVTAASVATAPRAATWHPTSVLVSLAEASRAFSGKPFMLAPIEPAFARCRRE